MAQLEVEIVNKVTNLSAVAEEKAALSGVAGGGFSPLGGGTVNFGGSLTRGEQAVAAAQMAELEGATRKTSSAFSEYDTKLKNAVIVSGEAGSITDGLARKMNALGQLGLSPTTGLLIGATIAVAGLVEAGKSMSENADKNEAAQKNLQQAFTTQKKVLADYQSGIDDFINSNRKYISSEYDVKDAFAAGIRAGFDYQMTLRLVNDALNLSAAAHIDLSAAMDDLIKLKTGRASQEFANLGIQIKGAVDPLKEVGAETKKVAEADKLKAEADRALAEDIQKLHDKQKVTTEDLMHLQDLKAKDAAATREDAAAHQALAHVQQELNTKGDLYQQQLAQVEAKTKDAKKSQTDLKQAQNDLNTTWQQFSDDYGPEVTTWMTNITIATAGAVGKIKDLLDFLKNDTGPAFNALDFWLTDQIHVWQDWINAVNTALTTYDKWVAAVSGTSGSAAAKAPVINAGRGFRPGRNT